MLAKARNQNLPRASGGDAARPHLDLTPAGPWPALTSGTVRWQVSLLVVICYSSHRDRHGPTLHRGLGKTREVPAVPRGRDCANGFWLCWAGEERAGVNRMQNQSDVTVLLKKKNTLKLWSGKKLML